VADADARAPEASPVAEMIYTAATDASDRLRYWRSPCSPTVATRRPT